MECFCFSEQRFPRICLNKVLLVSVQHVILSLPDFHHISFQRFSHFSIIIPIFHGGSFGVSPVKMAMAFLCVFGCSRGWPVVTFDVFFVGAILIYCFFFVSPLYTDPHENFNSYTPGSLLSINLSLFLHKVFFTLGPVWNATLNADYCISFLIFGPNFGIQGKVITNSYFGVY